MPRTDTSFDSNGARCAAWLYRPDADAGEHVDVPCVILAHGFSLVREGRLDAYAERFAAAGLAALVFDYRHFGASEGEPRQLLDLDRQRDDWRAALAHARTLDSIDRERIALWGTSFSGGHVVPVAASDGGVAAVVSQVPYARTGRAPGRPRPGFLARMVGAAVLDELRGRLGMSPGYIPVVGEPDEFAAFNRPGASAQLRSILPPHSTWENRYTPRVALRLPRYRPFEAAADLRCPWLLCVCDDDPVTPAEAAIAEASGARMLELRRYAAGHFDVYAGDWFERAVADQTEFLTRHLLA